MSKLKHAARADRKATHEAAKARDAWPIRIAGAASEAADQPPLVALSLATIALGAVLRRADVARGGVRMLVAHALATGVKTVLKASVDRTRPAKALKDGHRIGKGTGTDDTDLNSFPSGHTAGAVAVAQAAGRDMPAVAVPARVAALAVAAIQMPRAKHYISDVLAGAAIGLASEWAVSAAMRGAERAWAKRRSLAHRVSSMMKGRIEGQVVQVQRCFDTSPRFAGYSVSTQHEREGLAS